MNDYMNTIVNESIARIKQRENSFNSGRVASVRDYILEVTGLESVGYFEEVHVGAKAVGYVNQIRENSVIVAVVSQGSPVYVGDEVTATGREFMATFGKESKGHVVDMFGRDLLNGKRFEQTMAVRIENPTTPIMDRTAVNRPMRTGITGIDMLYPIGRGQRQLIIGDKKTGKTQLCLDAIVNQKGQKTLCIYIAIGRTKKGVKEIYRELARRGAMDYTIILAANNDDKPTVLSLTPYVGLAIAELYMKQGLDVLVVIDDLKRHADVYREIALRVGKTPGRDAYPADIFYTHSRLLEKGCQYKNGGSITILPIIETRGGDITDYISTNVISITDGQIVLSKKNFDKGQKPAIDYGLSVSRLGGAVQDPAVKKIGAKVRRELLSYLETREIYELANTDEMSPELKAKLQRGQRMLAALNQYKFSPIPADQMVATFTALVAQPEQPKPQPVQTEQLQADPAVLKQSEEVAIHGFDDATLPADYRKPAAK
ncbi:F0F1 ATP synthase subunit alpha [Bifidobacterium sp. LC6]|uniref:F0F1 ATP synthase subunit alpha n=1 Tax=Bifidobacterium colobi TaxID=2809026 RepID=A0ABS5UYS8_9BIFI|nr:F0F1 ATP synthase subunit alpha [Bifidobacterium colobi]MBT1175850.1 F0F1 ATP synthase subunit alpha [Bifidobacterium colobi]